MRYAIKYTPYGEIGKRLKSVRQYLVMTQLQVAEATGLTVITISKIEHDKVVSSDSFIQLLLFYSNYISMDFLLAKDFNLAEADRYTKSFSLNTIVKAKMEMIREEIDKDLSNIKKNYQQKLSDTIDLL
jgi:transcriptional regulator with XRE-family HTH domain